MDAPFAADAWPTSSCVAVICDYGGVLTNPLVETLAAYANAVGIPPERIQHAMGQIAAADGIAPMAQLEVGAITEQVFLAKIAAALPGGGDPPPDLSGFRQKWFAGRRPNPELIGYLKRLRQRGHRLALLTNNVAEWAPDWRATIPADELFELVVDSSQEGTRKPDRPIYERTLERLALPAWACVFVDDVEENCRTAEMLGMAAVRFVTTDQTVAEVELLLAPSPGELLGSRGR